MRCAPHPVVLALPLLACAASGRSAPPMVPASAPAMQPAMRALQDIAPGDFCVTCGDMQPQPDGRSLVTGPKMRAVVDRPTGAVTDLHFTYLGPTSRLMALSSGQSRIQVGLKLFAHDACNLVYVMWRLFPQPGVVVSTKRNAGMRSSSRCGNGGYANVRAVRQVPTPPVAVGMPHRLRVERDGTALSIYADQILAWEGKLEEALPDALTGITGVRSDNGRFILKLQLVPHTGDGPRGDDMPQCRAKPGVSPASRTSEAPEE